MIRKLLFVTATLFSLTALADSRDIDDNNMRIFQMNKNRRESCGPIVGPFSFDLYAMLEEMNRLQAVSACMERIKTISSNVDDATALLKAECNAGISFGVSSCTLQEEITDMWNKQVAAREEKARQAKIEENRRATEAAVAKRKALKEAKLNPKTTTASSSRPTHSLPSAPMMMPTPVYVPMEMPTPTRRGPGDPYSCRQCQSAKASCERIQASLTGTKAIYQAGTCAGYDCSVQCSF